MIPEKTFAVRIAAFIAAAIALPTMFGQTVNTSYDNSGLSSLRVNGTEYLGFGDLRVSGVSMKDQSGAIVTADLNSTTSVNANAGQITRTFGWGSVQITYSVSGNRLNFDIRTSNKSPWTITAMTIEPLGLRLPGTAQGWDRVTPMLGHNIGAPTVIPVSGNWGTVVLANLDVKQPLLAGFPWAYDGSAASYFPLRITTGRENMYPDSLPFITRTIAPNATDTYTFSLRFGTAGTTAQTLASDVYQQFATQFPATLRWADRRPIGMLVIGTSATGWAGNPRGWLLDAYLDIRTASGLASFRQRVLEWADRSVTNLRNMNAQGMVTWDIEGEQFPHPTTYVGDPRMLPALAPEMDGIADEYFAKFRAAGLRVGVCIRPQHFTLAPGGNSASQTTASDPYAELSAKIDYAKRRWGATLFYIDSNGDPSLPIDASIMQRLAAAYPDVLLIPEHENLQYFAYTAPFRQLRAGEQPTADLTRVVYPTGFAVIDIADAPFNASVLGPAITKGDVLMTRAWFDDGTHGLVRNLYLSNPSYVLPAAPAPTPHRLPPTPQPTPTPAPPPAPALTCPAPGNGTFTGCYYSGMDFNELKFVRQDASIHFDWMTGSPDASMPADRFSVRWQGNFALDEGTYQFLVKADDGIRIYVDGKLVSDHWQQRPITGLFIDSTQITKGTHTIRMDYFESTGLSSAHLWWIRK